jgi:hypothetical protein
MPRKASRLPLPNPGDPPSDQDDEWGAPPEAFGLGAVGELGAPPPQPEREPPKPPPASLMLLGPPPEDALAAAAWAYRLLMLQAYETMLRPQPEADRDKVVRTILRDAAKHQTDAARYDYMQLVEADKKELDARRRGEASAKLVPRPPAGEDAKVIPLRRDG